MMPDDMFSKVLDNMKKQFRWNFILTLIFDDFLLVSKDKGKRFEHFIQLLKEITLNVTTMILWNEVRSNFTTEFANFILRPCIISTTCVHFNIFYLLSFYITFDINNA